MQPIILFALLACTLSAIFAMELGPDVEGEALVDEGEALADGGDFADYWDEGRQQADRQCNRRCDLGCWCCKNNRRCARTNVCRRMRC